MNEDQNYALKPCPFCAGDATAWYDSGGHWVECDDCHARTLDEFDTESVAVSYWNMRHYEVTS